MNTMTNRNRLGMSIFVLVFLFGSLALASAQAVKLDIGLDQAQVLAGPAQKVYLKVGLVGQELTSVQRPIINVAIVLDRSGSMEGDKLRRAKQAASYAVSLLSPRDIVSVIVYDDQAEVLVPATRASNISSIQSQIEGIRTGGATALFAGVSLGAGEVRKFISRNQVNRVVLLSDGIANVGPDSPNALGDLGASLRKEGISVTTIGLGTGYNEDLMVKLAAKSDGNHSFVEQPSDLVRIFDAEFKDAMAIAATDINIIIECAPGVRPIRLMNRDGDIRDREVRLQLNQVLSSQEKYVLIELEIPAGSNGQNLVVANARAEYLNVSNQKRESSSQVGRVSFSADRQKISSSVNKPVKEQVVLQLATEANERALQLRDEGKTDEARKILESNVVELQQAAAELNSPALQDYARSNEGAAASLDNEDWDSQRKTMREQQNRNRSQQSY